MTILLSLRQATTLSQLANAVFRALAPTEPDLARKAATAALQARDLDAGVQAVLALREDLRVEWEEARPGAAGGI